MNLIENLREQAESAPDRPALIDRRKGRDRTLTYGQLWEQIGAGAAEMKAVGLSTGETVVFLHPVSLELYLGLLSALHAGLTAMFFDPSAKKSFIEGCCEMHAPQALYASPKAHLLRLTLPPVRGIPVRFHPNKLVPGSTRLRFRGEAANPVELPGDHPALITFTSGSTGQPKAIVRSHQFLLDQHAALASALELRAGEVDLATLPVFVLANLASGLTSVLADSDLAYPGRTDPHRIAHQCRAMSPTRCAASPAFFERLLTRPESLQSFTRLDTGGAPVFPGLLAKLQEFLPQARIFAVYGSSEAEPIAHIEFREISGEDHTRMTRGGGLLTGHPVPDIRLAIIPNASGEPLGPFTAEEFRALELPPESPGEIVVTGRHVLKGYLMGVGDEETKIRVADEVWHRTGDAGQLDHAGRLWLLGRASAILPAKDDLPELYPFSLEVALSEFPKVTRAAALAVKGQRWVTVEGSPDNRAAFEAIFSWAGIDRWIYIPSGSAIPMDRRHNAKVDYEELRAMIQRF